MHDVNASRASNAFVPLTASTILVNAVGLHARPSVKLTQCAKRFVAKIELAWQSATFSSTSPATSFTLS